jgi:uncharacterized protein (DUF58 family)
MVEKRRLNADIASSVAQLQSIIKQFEKKQKLYRIIIRGKGLEFEAYRNFTADDDAGLIDWKASTRANKLLTKQFKEERDKKIMFLIDVSENMVSGSTEKLKCEYAAEVSGALAHMIMNGGDKAGFLYFNEEITKNIRPSRGDRHFGQFLDDVTNAENYKGGSNLKMALDFAFNYFPRATASVVIVSDFAIFDEETKKSMVLVSRRFETLLISVKDPIDKTLPDFSDEVVIEDPKTGQQMIVNPAIAKQIYEQQMIEDAKFLKKTCDVNNIDLLELMTDKPFVPSLAAFLKERIVRGRFR